MVAATGSDTMTYHIHPDVGVALTAKWQDEADSSACDGTPRPFSISGPSEVLALLDEFATSGGPDEPPHCGVLAPPTEVTLAGAQREAAGVPLEAAFFAFAYPLSSLTNRFEELVVEQGRCEPWLFFLLVGVLAHLRVSRAQGALYDVPWLAHASAASAASATRAAARPSAVRLTAIVASWDGISLGP